MIAPDKYDQRSTGDYESDDMLLFRVLYSGERSLCSSNGGMPLRPCALRVRLRLHQQPHTAPEYSIHK